MAMSVVCMQFLAHPVAMFSGVAYTIMGYTSGDVVF